jgi:hypothetical protein
MPTVSESYAHCRRVARTRARNFYYSFLLLPREQKDAMCAIYAFMRYADDISDEPDPPLEARRKALSAGRLCQIIALLRKIVPISPGFGQCAASNSRALAFEAFSQHASHGSEIGRSLREDGGIERNFLAGHATDCRHFVCEHAHDSLAILKCLPRRRICIGRRSAAATASREHQKTNPHRGPQCQRLFHA